MDARRLVCLLAVALIVPGTACDQKPAPSGPEDVPLPKLATSTTGVEIEDLGTLGGSFPTPFSQAQEINDRGQIVGTGTVMIGSVLENHAFFWENGRCLGC